MPVIAVPIILVSAVLLDIFCGIAFRKPAEKERQPQSGMNHLHYYTNGHDLFTAMTQSICRARHHIYISFFIFIADEVGDEWIALLKKKAQEGVDVRLLVDRLGSFALSKQKHALEQAGVHFAFSGKISFPFTFYYLNRRNHRKMMTVDGNIGYFGGYNLSRDYLGRNSDMGPWHDNHLRLAGESVRALEQLFLEDWKHAAGNGPAASPISPPEQKGPARLTLIATDGKQLEDYFNDQLHRAQKSIVIGSPYFVPSKKLMRTLADRLDHGVRLTILLPFKKDHPLVRPASYHFLTPLAQKGAEIFHFYQGFYHSKIIVIDGDHCCLGTANFDRRSLFWNDELTGFSDDPQLVRSALDQLKKEINNQSVAVSYEQIMNRSPYAKLKTRCSIWFSYFL